MSPCQHCKQTLDTLKLDYTVPTTAPFTRPERLMLHKDISPAIVHACCFVTIKSKRLGQGSYSVMLVSGADGSSSSRLAIPLGPGRDNRVVKPERSSRNVWPTSLPRWKIRLLNMQGFMNEFPVQTHTPRNKSGQVRPRRSRSRSPKSSSSPELKVESRSRSPSGHTHDKLDVTESDLTDFGSGSGSSDDDLGAGDGCLACLKFVPPGFTFERHMTKKITVSLSQSYFDADQARMCCIFGKTEPELESEDDDDGATRNDNDGATRTRKSKGFTARVIGQDQLVFVPECQPTLFRLSFLGTHGDEPRKAGQGFKKLHVPAWAESCIRPALLSKEQEAELERWDSQALFRDSFHPCELRKALLLQPMDQDGMYEQWESLRSTYHDLSDWPSVTLMRAFADERFKRRMQTKTAEPWVLLLAELMMDPEYDCGCFLGLGSEIIVLALSYGFSRCSQVRLLQMNPGRSKDWFVQVMRNREDLALGDFVECPNEKNCREQAWLDSKVAAWFRTSLAGMEHEEAGRRDRHHDEFAKLRRDMQRCCDREKEALDRVRALNIQLRDVSTWMAQALRPSAGEVVKFPGVVWSSVYEKFEALSRVTFNPGYPQDDLEPVPPEMTYSMNPLIAKSLQSELLRLAFVDGVCTSALIYEPDLRAKLAAQYPESINTEEQLCCTSCCHPRMQFVKGCMCLVSIQCYECALKNDDVNRCPGCREQFVACGACGGNICYQDNNIVCLSCNAKVFDCDAFRRAKILEHKETARSEAEVLRAAAETRRAQEQIILEQARGMRRAEPEPEPEPGEELSEQIEDERPVNESE